MPSSRTGNVEDHPELVMPLQVLFLRHFEQCLASEREVMELEKAERENSKDKPKSNSKAFDKKYRLFSLLPTQAGFDCAHIKLCSNGLYGLLKST